MITNEYITLKAAIQRLNDAISAGCPVLFYDGTLNERVVSIKGDEEARFPYLTMILEDGFRLGIDITHNGYLNGWNLRNDLWSLIIAPAVHLDGWPCTHPGCIASIDGYCAVGDCKGACVRPGRSYKTVAGVVRAYKHYMDSGDGTKTT